MDLGVESGRILAQTSFVCRAVLLGDRFCDTSQQTGTLCPKG
ncbi:hypothetical protein [Pseudorhodobacter turbinis]|nr:hypothetical protein [Pseudorhodobacter turbinis]